MADIIYLHQGILEYQRYQYPHTEFINNEREEFEGLVESNVNEYHQTSGLNFFWVHWKLHSAMTLTCIISNSTYMYIMNVQCTQMTLYWLYVSCHQEYKMHFIIVSDRIIIMIIDDIII